MEVKIRFVILIILIVGNIGQSQPPLSAIEILQRILSQLNIPSTSPPPPPSTTLSSTPFSLTDFALKLKQLIESFIAFTATTTTTVPPSASLPERIRALQDRFKAEGFTPGTITTTRRIAASRPRTTVGTTSEFTERPPPTETTRLSPRESSSLPRSEPNTIGDFSTTSELTERPPPTETTRLSPRESSSLPRSEPNTIEDSTVTMEFTERPPPTETTEEFTPGTAPGFF